MSIGAGATPGNESAAGPRALSPGVEGFTIARASSAGAKPEEAGGIESCAAGRVGRAAEWVGVLAGMAVTIEAPATGAGPPTDGIG
jgi:hypothetical protein